MNENRYDDLDDLMIRYKTHKSSLHHDYAESYSNAFAPLKDKAIKFLEIGIDEGDSVRVWEGYFSRAELHFIDIKTSCFYKSTRSHYHIADQQDAQQLSAVMQQTGGNFDIIIDDGGTSMAQQVTSFSTLFPHVKSQGLYIVENLNSSYWEESKGTKELTTIHLLKTLVDQASPSSWCKKEIHSIAFYSNLAIIIKR